jgi:hypothetical protein
MTMATGELGTWRHTSGMIGNAKWVAGCGGTPVGMWTYHALLCRYMPVQGRHFYDVRIGPVHLFSLDSDLNQVSQSVSQSAIQSISQS